MNEFYEGICVGALGVVALEVVVVMLLFGRSLVEEKVEDGRERPSFMPPE